MNLPNCVLILFQSFYGIPYANADTIINDFLMDIMEQPESISGKYIDEMREALLSSDQPLKIFGSPIDASVSYLTPALISGYKQIFDEAEKSVADDPILLERVRIARQPLNFAIMEQFKKEFHR